MKIWEVQIVDPKESVDLIVGKVIYYWGIDNCSGAWYKGLRAPLMTNFSLFQLEQKTFFTKNVQHA